MIIVNQIKLFRPIFIFINFINKQVLASHLYKSICQVEQTMAGLDTIICTIIVQITKQIALSQCNFSSNHIFSPTTLQKNFFNLSLHPKQPYMKYKLIVLDLDGTLTNSKKEITPRNRETLIRMQEQGIRLVLASGRPTYGIVPLANELRMNEFGGFILSYNGGEIINWETQEMVYENVLPNEVVPVLYECARTHQLSILTYDGAEIITENSQDPYVLKEAFLNKMAVRETNDFLTDITLPVAKCLIVGDSDKLIPLEAELCLRLQGRINVFRSEPYFLELVPQGIDKALSLAVLLKEIGVAREEVIAIGDGYNDLSMIKFAGLGIAMGNAQEPIKKAADYITLSNEEDGVAEAINKFCNQQ